VRPRLQDVLEDRLCPSGYLLVTSSDTNSVMRYDEVTGAPAPSAGNTGATFVSKNSGGLSQPTGLVFGPNDLSHLYVTSGVFGGNPGGNGHPNAVLRYDGTTGSFIDDFADETQLTSARGVVFGPDGNLYVADGTGTSDGTVVVYDGKTGRFLRDFFPRGTGGLSHPGGLVFGPDGLNDGKLDLYIASAHTNSILRFSFSSDGRSGVEAPSAGNTEATFVPANSGGLDHPFALTIGPDGNLYVASLGVSSGLPSVMRFDGKTGAPLPSAGNSGTAIFVASGSGGLMEPESAIFGPDGRGDGGQDLYVSSVDPTGSNDHGTAKTSTVLRYDSNGNPAPAPGYPVTSATFIPANSGGLDNPSFLIFTETDPTTLAYAGTTTAQANAAAPGTTAGTTPTNSAASAFLPLAPATDPAGGDGWPLDPRARPRQRVHHAGSLGA
jgi:glucose/arabinose dehydrogenase